MTPAAVGAEFPGEHRPMLPMQIVEVVAANGTLWGDLIPGGISERKREKTEDIINHQAFTH